MISADFLIIGGGIAGISAVETIRKRDAVSRVAIIESEPYFLYSRILLPEFVKNSAGLDRIMLRSKSDYQKNNIKIYLKERVSGIDPVKRLVKTNSGKNFSYKKLLLAAGGRPADWRFEKEAPENIFRLQTLDDAKRMIKFFKTREKGLGLVVGGGLVALEFLKILSKNNYETKLILNTASFWPEFFDDDGFGLLSESWNARNIELIKDDEIISVRPNGTKAAVKTKKGGKFIADFIGVGTGLKRNIDFLPSDFIGGNGVSVNGYLQTFFPDIWAAGDIAYYPDFFTGRRLPGRNWSGAYLQGKIAGINMTGGREPFKYVPSCSVNHFGCALTLIGDGLDAPDIKEGFCFFKKSAKKYIRIFERGGAAAGAILINSQKFVGSVTQAIMNKESAKNLINTNEI